MKTKDFGLLCRSRQSSQNKLCTQIFYKYGWRINPATSTHGFRAMASTILNGNKTHEIKGFDLPPFDPDLIEIQLSHAEDNKIRKAYNRRDPYARIQERREMVQRYADLLFFLKNQFWLKNHPSTILINSGKPI